MAKQQDRTLGAVTKERRRDLATVDSILAKVKRGEITKKDAGDNAETIAHFQKRNDARMAWAEESLVETSKARRSIEKDYHTINELLVKIEDKVVLPAGNGSSGKVRKKVKVIKKDVVKESTTGTRKTTRKHGLTSRQMLAKGGKKQCFVCFKTKKVTQFGKDKYRPDGLKSGCRECGKEYYETRKKERAIA